MKPKLLRERYTTLQGATKRAAFENAVAPGEYARGEKARVYAYRVTQDDTGAWRVERHAHKAG